MARTGVFILTASLLCMQRSYAQQAILRPGSFKAYQNQTVNITCEVNGAGEVVQSVTWRINGDNYNLEREFLDNGIMPPAEYDEEDTFTSILTVTATMIRHNTTFQCIGLFTRHAGIYSDVFTLLVQGLLSRPENLSIAEEDSTHLHLSWNAPPTLNLTTVDPDVSGYQVCTNVTSLCWKTEETGFSVPRLAVPVEWSVSALNVVGEGSPATVQQQPCSLGDSPLPSQDDITIEISFLSELELKLEFHFPVEEDCFPLYQLNCTLQSSGSQTSHSPALPSVISGGTTSVTVTLELELELVFNERYSVQLSVSGGTADPMLVIMDHFTTYDVQRVDVVTEPGAIEVTCFFANGSQAQGCHVTIIWSDSGDSNIVFGNYVTRSGDADSAVHRWFQLDAGLYLVTVYDIESDGSIALDNPVVEKSVTISHLAPSIIPTTSVTLILSTITNKTITPTQTPTESTQNNTTLITIIGAVLGSFITVIVVASLMLTTLIVRMQHKAQHSMCSEIVLQSNQVYDVMKQQQQTGRAVQLEPCSRVGTHQDVDDDPEYEIVS